MCKPRRRKSFVLLEVLIATALFAVLLTAMFSIFWRTSKLSQAITNKRLAIEKVLLVETKLQNVFANISNHEADRSYFYIEKSRHNNLPSLVFTFDNQVHRDFAYSATVLGKLHVENEKLFLSLWPHKNEFNERDPSEMRQERLLEDVTDFAVALFAGPQLEEKEEAEKGVGGPRPCQWTTNWPKDYQAQPALIKLTIQQKNRAEPIVLSFLVPDQINIIPYDNRR